EQLSLAWKPLRGASQVFVLGFVIADGRMLLKPPPGPRPRPWRAAVKQPRLGIRELGGMLAPHPEPQQRIAVLGPIRRHQIGDEGGQILPDHVAITVIP